MQSCICYNSMSNKEIMSKTAGTNITYGYPLIAIKKKKKQAYNFITD